LASLADIKLLEQAREQAQKVKQFWASASDAS
jgi:hypothetical protein